MKKNRYFDIKNDDIIKYNRIKNIKTNINYLTAFIIKFLIIIKFQGKVKSYVSFFNDSKITLKIKGKGESNIFGNEKSDNFNNIRDLKQIIINGIIQKNIDYKYFFEQTDNLVELIWVDGINNCKNMFFKCFNITEINLSNFDSSQVTDMYAMFFNCSSLTSLDLSNIDTSNVHNMHNMFSHCSALTSLNLSNFDISKVTQINEMFSYCINLEYINIYNFEDSSNLNSYSDIFLGVPENIVICAKGGLMNKEKIFPQIKNKNCYVNDCSNDWKSKQKKIINNTNQCTDNCGGSTQYEYNGKCYEECQNGIIENNNNNHKKCKCQLDKCLTCPNVALNKNLCTKCNTNYYPKENDPLNLGEYINCYNRPEEGYYLDYNYSIYKKCYYTCKKCNISGYNLTHNCIECKDNFQVKIEKNNYYNCYENYSSYHQDIENTSLYINNLVLSTEYNNNYSQNIMGILK